MRSASSRCSGANFAAKSSASNTCRISISASSPGMGLGQRLTQSIASFSDLHCQIQKPATSPLVSAKGPSITVCLFPENLTRAPLRTRLQPLGGEHQAGFGEFLVEFAHFGQKLLARHRACL